MDRFSELFFSIGLFLFPFLLVMFLKNIKEIKLKDTLWMAIPFIVMFLIISKGRFDFPVGNIFNAYGLGPETLYDTTILGLNKAHSESKVISMAVYILSRAGLLLLVINISYFIIRFCQNQSFKKPENSFKIFILLLAICYFVLVSVSNSFFDRYLMPFLAIALLFFVTWPQDKKILKIIVVVYIVITGTFSLLATHDYFKWNKIRYSLINETIKRGVKPEQINGGFEYLAREVSITPWYGVWMSNNTPYYVSFGRIPGYEIYKYKTYRRFLTVKRDTVFLMKWVNLQKNP